MVRNPLFCADHIIRCLWGWVSHLLVSRLQGLPNDNLGAPVKFEFQINNTVFKNISMSPTLHRAYLYSKIMHCVSEIQIELAILNFIWPLSAMAYLSEPGHAHEQ